jgi:catechol 2,3-dioxygenase-like lactoylglutathione lyase family enzyme
MPESLPLAGLNHIARETTDVDRCLRFYRDVLGFRQVRRPDFNFGGAWLYNYGFMIHVIEGKPPLRPGEISTRADHVAFHTDDSAAVERLLGEHGISYRRNVNAAGVTQLFFHDPDGNHIEIGCYPPVQELDDAYSTSGLTAC